MELIPKLNVAIIVSGHWATLVDDTTGKKSGDVFVFYGFPALVVAAMGYAGMVLAVDAANVIVNALAIMTGLLFNLLVVLQGLSATSRSKNERVRAFTRDVYNNIAYAIFVSLVTMMPLVVAANYEDSSRLGFKISGWIALYLVFHFALTMVMVLKRMYKMLQAEFA